MSSFGSDIPFAGSRVKLKYTGVAERKEYSKRKNVLLKMLIYKYVFVFSLSTYHSGFLLAN